MQSFTIVLGVGYVELFTCLLITFIILEIRILKCIFSATVLLICCLHLNIEIQVEKTMFGLSDVFKILVQTVLNCTYRELLQFWKKSHF